MVSHSGHSYVSHLGLATGYVTHSTGKFECYFKGLVNSTIAVSGSISQAFSRAVRDRIIARMSGPGLIDTG